MEYSQEINSFNRKNKRVQHLLVLSKFIKSKKLYLKILVEETKLVKILFKIILKYFYMKKYIEISNNPIENMKKIRNIISEKFRLKKEFEIISKFIALGKIHKDSAMEIMKKEKIIIINEKGESKNFKTTDLINFSKKINKIKKETNRIIIKDNYKKV